jgi:hypothetical protein
MKPNLFISFFILLVSCSDQSSQRAKTQTEKSHPKSDPAYVWTKLSDSAGWKKSYNFQMFGLKDTLWTFHHDGNWFSADGMNWTKSALPNSIYNLGFLDYVQFNETVLGLGHFEGNIEQFIFRPEIYKTTGFKTWDTLSTQSNLPHRFFYHPFVFNHKIWIIGGEDQAKTYSDIWNSDNGVVWVKQKENSAFGKRSNSQIVNLNGKLFLLNNDVWSSDDAIHWQKETDEIVKGIEIFGYAAVVFDNKIWLLGCNRNGQFTSQVLVSADGKNWQGQTAPWTPRGGIAAAVYKNKIYITGGKYGGTANRPDFIYSNDVWTLEKKE